MLLQHSVSATDSLVNSARYYFCRKLRLNGAKAEQQSVSSVWRGKRVTEWTFDWHEVRYCSSLPAPEKGARSNQIARHISGSYHICICHNMWDSVFYPLSKESVFFVGVVVSVWRPIPALVRGLMN